MLLSKTEMGVEIYIKTIESCQKASSSQISAADCERAAHALIIAQSSSNGPGEPSMSQLSNR